MELSPNEGGSNTAEQSRLANESDSISPTSRPTFGEEDNNNIYSSDLVGDNVNSGETGNHDQNNDNALTLNGKSRDKKEKEDIEGEDINNKNDTNIDTNVDNSYSEDPNFEVNKNNSNYNDDRSDFVNRSPTRSDNPNKGQDLSLEDFTAGDEQVPQDSQLDQNVFLDVDKPSASPSRGSPKPQRDTDLDQPDNESTGLMNVNDNYDNNAEADTFGDRSPPENYPESGDKEYRSATPGFGNKTQVNGQGDYSNEGQDEQGGLESRNQDDWQNSRGNDMEEDSLGTFTMEQPMPVSCWFYSLFKLRFVQIRI